jgi:DNA-binding NtrC family response regulator
MTQAKLMLVDDEAAFVESLARRLSARGYKTVCALSGQEALDQLQKHGDTDVAVLDVKMPGMDGIETLREIKSRYPLIEVVMLTGHGTVESAVEGMKLGAFDYVLKPCEIDELARKIEAAAAQKRHYTKKLMEELAQPYRPKMDERELLRKIKEKEEPV